MRLPILADIEQVGWQQQQQVEEQVEDTASQGVEDNQEQQEQQSRQIGISGRGSTRQARG